MDRSLPADLADKFGHLRFIRFKGNEWRSECPNCRDDGHEGNDPPDRFIMFPAEPGKSARGWCRQCGHFEWAVDAFPSTPARSEQTQLLRRQYAKKERSRLHKKIKWLQQQTFWIEWHDQMTEKHRDLWRKEGIGDWAIETHKLGYRPDYHLRNGDDTPAMTIPYLYKDKIQTVQFRLLEPNEGGKYRFLKDTSPMWFKPWPSDPAEDIIVIVEGAKKGIITFQHAALAKYRGKKTSIIATPSKHVPNRLMGFLKKRDPELVIWLLDPDAYESTISVTGKRIEPAINRNVTAFGPERSLIIKPIAKIDDMFTQYGLDCSTFQAMLNQAGPLNN